MPAIDVAAAAAGAGDSREARRAVTRALAARRARALRAAAGLAVAALLAACVSVSVGDYPIPLADVVPALLGLGDEATTIVARELRLPRVLGGLLVGAALGLSGAIYQAVARNPLASPDILGVLQGGAVAAVFGITVLGASAALVSVSAFAGALAMTIAIYLLAYRQGVSSYRFVLVGIGLAAIGTALVNWLLTRADIFSAAAATVWLTGSLSAIGWESVVPTAVAFAGLTAVALVLMRRLRALQLGDDTAKGLGVEVERSRLALLIVGVAAAGVAAAAAGPIMFVAFMAQPIARRLTGAPLTLVPAALAGAVLVVASDLVARTLFPSTEIPVGVVTGIVGAPYLLWLLARANRIGRGG